VSKIRDSLERGGVIRSAIGKTRLSTHRRDCSGSRIVSGCGALQSMMLRNTTVLLERFLETASPSASPRPPA